MKNRAFALHGDCNQLLLTLCFPHGKYSITRLVSDQPTISRLRIIGQANALAAGQTDKPYLLIVANHEHAVVGSRQGATTVAVDPATDAKIIRTKTSRSLIAKVPEGVAAACRIRLQPEDTCRGHRKLPRWI